MAIYHACGWQDKKCPVIGCSDGSAGRERTPHPNPSQSSLWLGPALAVAPTALTWNPQPRCPLVAAQTRERRDSDWPSQLLSPGHGSAVCISSSQDETLASPNCSSPQYRSTRGRWTQDPDGMPALTVNKAMALQAEELGSRHSVDINKQRNFKQGFQLFILQCAGLSITDI